MKASKLARYLGMTAIASFAIFIAFQPTEVKAYDTNYPTQDEIRERYSEMGFSLLKPIEYTKDYSTTSPYEMGDISDEDRQQALNAVNFCRYIAGLPSDLTLEDTYNEYTQAASLVNASNDLLTHYPEQPKDMSDELYNKGKIGASSSNIASGYYNIADSIINGYIVDTDDYNIGELGHRRWVLNPSMQKTGFGIVDDYTAMYVFDRTRSQTFTDDYVAWPPKNMPNEIYSNAASSEYGYAFSVNLNSNYDYPELSKVTVDLKSKLLGKSWHLDSNSTDIKNNYLTVNNDGYGMSRCIIFNVGAFPENDTVTVKINGITKNGVSAPISYTVNFFDLFDKNSEYGKMGFEQDTYNIEVGDTISISPYNNPLESKTFSWSLSGNLSSFKYNLVSNRLVVTALNPGTMTVYAEYNGVTYTTKITSECKHNYKLISSVDASCTKEGSKTYKCSICGATKTETVPKTAHKYSTEWTIDVEPTANSEGSKSHHCTVCGAKTDITAIPKLNESLKNVSTISATEINLGSSIKMTAKATGGTAPYKYKYYCRPSTSSNYTALTGTTTSTTCSHKPARAITYYYAVKIADSKGVTKTKYFTVKVSNAALANVSTISATNITLGTTIKMTAKATGGTAPYKYKYYCRPETSSNYTALTGTTTSTTCSHKPARAITYYYAVKIADSKGVTKTKYFTVKVSNAALANASTISATNITLGKTITMTAKATGGSGSYKYKYYCRPAGNTAWTALTGTTTEASFSYKPARAIKYDFAVKIADSQGNTSTKYFEVTVTK